MNLLSLFGFGEKRIWAENNSVTGQITAVQTCWWIKVNTKPVRKHMWDGAMYPHIVTFSYTVDGKTYEGKRFLSYNAAVPSKGDSMRIYYRKDAPQKYAVKL